jgi:ribulose kinase
MLPDFWLNEGGQSATGALLDHVLDWHAEGRALGVNGHEKVQQYIGEKLAASSGDFQNNVLVVPDFNGNRSPFANPHMRGAIYGLDLDASFDSLARLYHGAATGIGYGTRQIIAALDSGGYAIREIFLTGGHAKSALLTQIYADTTGCDIILPRETDAVLLGTGIVAAVAAGWHADLTAAGRAMVHTGRRVAPSPATRALHDRRYAIFKRMVGLGREFASAS